MYCIFTNDNNVEIKLIEHQFSDTFRHRNIYEGIFRQINTYLINNNIIDKDKNIIDLGAWIGDNSIPWAKNINGIVYAIDPSSDNCDFMNQMKIVNDINNLIIIKGVISDSEKIVSTDSDNLQHCSFKNNDSLKTKMQSFCLDTLYKQNIIKNITYIHLDVEGMEKLVIYGSSNLIDELNPTITFEQHLNSDNYEDLCKYLINKNYRVFLINELLLGCAEDCRNFIAFPNVKFNDTLLNDIEETLNYKGLFIEII
jgi:FkbM family methyltransferase